MPPHRKYASDSEKPVSVSLRMPRALHAEAVRYARLHRLSMSELLIDGVRLRLDTPVDLRDVVPSRDRDVQAALHAMIDRAVEAALARRSPAPPGAESWSGPGAEPSGGQADESVEQGLLPALLQRLAATVAEYGTLSMADLRQLRGDRTSARAQGRTGGEEHP